jgi:hypothetical protein
MTEDDDLLKSVKDLATIMASMGDLDQFSSDLSDLFIKCFSQLSVQSPILSTLLALIYKQDQAFPALVVGKLTRLVTASLADGDVMTCKLALRAICCLASTECVAIEGSGSLCVLLDALLSVAYAAWTSSMGSSDATLSIEGQVASFLVASCIPWCANALASTDAGKEVLSRSAGQCARVVSDWSAASPYHVGGSQAIFHINAVPDDEDGVSSLTVGPSGVLCWDTLWESCKMALDVINDAKADGFVPPTCMNCLWLQLPEDFGRDHSTEKVDLGEGIGDSIADLSRDGKICSAQATSKAADTHVIGASTASWLRPCFSIFDSDSSEKAAKLISTLSSYEKCLAAGYFRDILYFFDPVIRENGTYIGTVELMSSHMIAVGKLFPNVQHLEYLLFEVLFQMVLQQPVNTIVNAGIYRLLLQVCQTVPSAPPALALCVSILVQMLPELDCSACRELSRWLSFHLINTKLKWPYWLHWVTEYESAEENSSVRSFIRTVVDRCGRVTVPQQMKEALPSEFHALLPIDLAPKCSLCENVNIAVTTEADGTTITNTVIGDGATGETTSSMPVDGEETKTDFAVVSASNEVEVVGLEALVAQLFSMIEKKVDAEVVEEWMEKDRPSVDNSIEGEHWRLKAVMQVIFRLANITLSSLEALIDRYIDPIRMHADTDAAQSALLGYVLEISGHDSGMLNIILDLLLRRGVVSVTSVAEWITSSSYFATICSDTWAYSHVETLVDRTIDIVRASVQHRKQMVGGASLSKLALPDFDGLINFSDSSSDVADARSERRAGPDDVEDDDGPIIGRAANRGDDDDDDDRGRRRGDDSAIGSISTMTEDKITERDTMDEDEDPVSLANDALRLSIQNTRKVYADVVGKLLSALGQYPNIFSEMSSDSSDSEYSGWEVAAVSLLQRALRSFHGLQELYSKTGDNLLLCDTASVETSIAEIESVLNKRQMSGYAIKLCKSYM